MDWIQFFGFIIAIAGLFYWSRTEANADRRELRASIDTLRDSTYAILSKMNEESKEFHGRLLVLEDRYLRIREKKEDKK